MHTSNTASAPLLEGFYHQLQTKLQHHSRSQIALINEVTTYLLDSGKRTRARLAWLVGHSFHLELDVTQKDQLLDLGCAIELIHLATLLHDDVIDQSLLRRGKQSVHLRWGVSEAVLVGDFIYSRAFEILVQISNPQVLALTAQATNRLAEGEVEQLLSATQTDRSASSYFDVISKKTGALFGCACAAAASISGAEHDQCNALYQLGMGVGVAFQIIDDIIDYTGTSSGMGKQPGDDYHEGKVTLPLIMLLARSQPNSRVHQLIANPHRDHVPELLTLMQEQDVFACCVEAAQQQLAPALAVLNALPDGPAKTLLNDEMEQLLHLAVFS